MGLCKQVSANGSRTFSRALYRRPDIVVWAQNRAARVLGNGASVAAAKMLELIHSNSSRVQFEASRHVLALAGLKPPPRIVGGEPKVIDTKPTAE